MINIKYKMQLIIFFRTSSFNWYYRKLLFITQIINKLQIDKYLMMKYQLYVEEPNFDEITTKMFASMRGI